MNRQLVAFLSMFSLVLVLSIYYVMLPAKSTKNDIPVINTITNGEDPYFSTILLEQEANHNQIIEEQYAIVSSSEYTNAEKAVALEIIAAEQETMQNEKQLREVIMGVGYPTCFVEIRETCIYVLTKSENKTVAEVAEIIYHVQDFLDREVNVQVAFR